MKSIRPLNDNIVVKAIDPSDTSTGGIVLVGGAADKSSQADVIAVGPGRVLDSGEVYPVGVAAGNRVLYNGERGAPVEIGGEEYLILNPFDIFAVVD